MSGTGLGHEVVQARPPVLVPAATSETETGLGSWYGSPYHGRLAASGHIYDMDKLTAAHRALPFGTLVRVRNLINARSVDVKITDRGPFVSGRIIDVSRAAARILGIEEAGLTPVRLEVLRAKAATAE
jgi:rare lipoprotein A